VNSFVIALSFNLLKSKALIAYCKDSIFIRRITSNLWFIRTALLAFAALVWQV